MKKLGKIGYYIFFGALIFIAFVVILSAFPIKGNIQIKVVESGSMEPAIKTGSVALIKPSSSYKIGDIITFEGNFKNAKGQKVSTTHRIVKARVESGTVFYTTKGDANENVDSREVRESQIVGKVLFNIPYVGYAVETARTTYGFLALILIPALIIIFDQARNIWEEVARKKQERERVKEKTYDA